MDRNYSIFEESWQQFGFQLTYNGLPIQLSKYFVTICAIFVLKQKIEENIEDYFCSADFLTNYSLILSPCLPQNLLLILHFLLIFLLLLALTPRSPSLPNLWTGSSLISQARGLHRIKKCTSVQWANYLSNYSSY